ncbi:glycoside hydrolase family 43 protein [Xylariales sp. AK1849]|nr:glycoside hydrolase family 43 protein [Xylariales sp. AK1849]
MRLVLKSVLALLTILAGQASAISDNSTYYNPILPGWHSDPSCTQVNGTFFCIASTFISFPGLPVYASKDLTNWKLVSHVWNRETQLRGVSWNTTGQQDGMYAATIRYHDGQFYVIGEYVAQNPGSEFGVLFQSTDPFNEETWSDALILDAQAIDLDLFWDDDGKVYVASQGIILQDIDLETGELSQPPISIWNGTGGVWPEGPHLYKKDGWYYLMIAEGGTGTNHSATIARSRSVTGPYDAYADNPILTNRDTNEYFQTVGHADLFQDTGGNWWGMSLATRSGPEFEIYPMGRETVLFPVTWDEGQWPILQPVSGQMTGWPLPPTDRDVPGDGPFNADPDAYGFEEGTRIPRNLVYWRVPQPGTFSTTSQGLQIAPSRSNLTGDPQSPELSGQHGLAFIGRRQTHTLFTFTVDLSVDSLTPGQEAGVTLFLTQFNHIDLGIVSESANTSRTGYANTTSQFSLRFHAEAADAPADQTIPLPAGWENGPIRLQIQTVNATYYSLTAMLAANPNTRISVATASAKLVTGGTGPYTGTLVGVYATCNGAGSGDGCAGDGLVHANHWRYTGAAQQISSAEYVIAGA